MKSQYALPKGMPKLIIHWTEDQSDGYGDEYPHVSKMFVQRHLIWFLIKENITARNDKKAAALHSPLPPPHFPKINGEFHHPKGRLIVVVVVVVIMIMILLILFY